MKSILFILFGILFCNISICQNKIEFALKNGKSSLFKNENFELSKLSKFQNTYYALLQLKSNFNKLVLIENGITLHHLIGNNIYAVSISKKIETLPSEVLYYGNYPIDLKYDANQLYNIVPNKNNYISVSYFGITKDSLINILQKIGITEVQILLPTASIINVTYTKENILKLAQFPFIDQLIVNSNETHLLNDESKKAHGITNVTNENGRNLTGQGITIGHGDLGLPRDHIDLWSKSIDNYNGPGNFHGNHTSGIASGAGLINEKYIGIAPKSPTINAFFDEILYNTPSYIIDYNMVATNNSYYSGLGGCPGQRVYNNLSVFIDSQSNVQKTNLHVFSAGNDGQLTCSPFPSFFGTIKSGFQTSKNVLSVGSLNTDTYVNAALSSRGPTNDGRLKPEIIAKGENVTSTVPVDIYDFTTGGTSMASPVVTGSVALLQQRYKQLHGITANSDIIKALLCNSADDLGNQGPDYTFGFGMLNIRKSVEALENNQYFTGIINTTGQTNTHTINVPTNTRRLKAMLYWIDKESNIVAVKNLVNDVDITVTEPNTTLHFPYILDATPSNVNNLAVEGRDSLNNIEQCTINNPVAGAYTVSINGFDISNPNQNYIVAYEIEQNGITVEFPNGGEKLVPNETEKIRWTAYGNESNTFTIEYSIDNGANWVLINNNVPSTARKYDWTVPNLPNVVSLIRVSRNATALIGTSISNFTILDVPTVTVNNSCNGAALVSWTTVASATNYQILVNDADSMKIIGTSTGSNFLVTGLNTTKTYWFTVRAMLGTKTGRRAIAKSIIPSSGTCTDIMFDNDIKLVSINTPTTGRYLTSTATQALQAINITLLNNDNAISNTTFDVNYSINGGATVTQSITPTINPGATYLHTFATHSPSTLPATYNIKVWVTKPGDINNNNDTIVKQVKLLPNAIVSLPFIEDFETTTKATYKESQFSFLNNERFDFFSTSTIGRARTYVNTGFAHSGNNAITIDQLPFGSLITNLITSTYNTTHLDTANNQIRLEVYVRNQGQENYAANKIFIRGSDTDIWIEAYDLNLLESYLGIYKKVSINVNDILASAVPKQQFSSSFQIGFGESGYTIATLVKPLNNRDDGYTFDDIKIEEAFNDLALTELVNPKINSCNTTNNTAITINIKNYSKTPQSNINVSYSINGGAPITETISSIAASQNLQYTLQH